MVENKVIGIVGPCPPMSGGVATHVDAITQRLKKKNKVFVIAGSYQGNHKKIVDENLIVYRDKVVNRRGLTVISWAGQQFKRSYLLSSKFDIIHTHTQNSSLVSLFRENIPVVMTVHGYPAYETVSIGRIKDGDMEFRFLRWVEKETARHAKAIIAVDRRIYNWLLEEIGYNESKLHYIPNGADVDRFSPKISGDIVKRKYGIREDEKIIICCKHLVPKNGIEYLIMAMPKILKIYRNTMLFLIGEGEIEDNLQKLVNELNINKNVVFCGVVEHDKIPHYLAVSNVSVIPSVKVSGVEEATSITLLESMASGKPVVASNIGGLKEILKGKDIGLLVPDKDPDALTKAILYILGHPEESRRMGLKARDYVIKNHSWDSVVKKISEVYLSVIENDKY